MKSFDQSLIDDFFAKVVKLPNSIRLGKNILYLGEEPIPILVEWIS